MMTNETPSFTIASAALADETGWFALWRAYLRFYKTHLPEGVSRATWRRILDEAHPFRCFLAKDTDGTAIGFALHFAHPSSWCPVGDMYLEDLYVAVDARGKGVGRALIEAIVERAKAEKIDRVYWMANEDNATARALYDKLTGGHDGHVRYRLSP